MYIDKATVSRLKAEYPAGTRVMLDCMGDDPRPIPSGTPGTVVLVDDIGTLHCAFDNGRELGLLFSVDSYHKIGGVTV